MNNYSYPCGDAGIIVSSGGPLIEGKLITENTTSSECGNSGGIYALENSAVQVLGNVISGNGGGGITVYQSTSAVNISQNVVTLNAGPGIYVYSGAGSVKIVQNLVASNQGTGLSWYSPPVTAVSNTITNNGVICCYGNQASEINGNAVDSTVVLDNNLVAAVGDYRRIIPVQRTAHRN